jgi:hypothetical protein
VLAERETQELSGTGMQVELIGAPLNGRRCPRMVVDPSDMVVVICTAVFASKPVGTGAGRAVAIAARNTRKSILNVSEGRTKIEGQKQNDRDWYKKRWGASRNRMEMRIGFVYSTFFMGIRSSASYFSD